jgi:2-hydroxychromene-2-carboxylate isomerase
MSSSLTAATSVTWYFDYSSPYTYLASTRLEDLCARYGYDLSWRPVLVGGIFNAINQSVYQARGTPAKARYGAKDVTDWASYYGIPFSFPSVFPVNSVKALRGALLAIEKGLISPYSSRTFRAYWAEDRDISDDAVLIEIAQEVGIDEKQLIAWTQAPQAREQLRAITQEAMDRGVFGSPSIFLGDDMYFGNDRLVLLENAMQRATGTGQQEDSHPRKGENADLSFSRS